MRILRFNEAKRHKIIDNANKFDDLKKSWQEIEDQSPWDFEYFWDKIVKCINDPNRYQDMLDMSLTDIDFEIESNHYDSGNNDLDWKKRQARISSRTCTGGYSGGSCWNDDYARPYETGNTLDMEDFLKWVGYVLTHIFGKNHPFADIDVLLQKLRSSNYIKDGDYTEYEYYGNSDDYRLYYITLWDLYQFLVKNSAF